MSQRVTMYLDAGQALGTRCQAVMIGLALLCRQKVVKNESSLALARRDQKAYGP